jgi:hypothetical protein
LCGCGVTKRSNGRRICTFEWTPPKLRIIVSGRAEERF